MKNAVLTYSLALLSLVACGTGGKEKHASDGAAGCVKEAWTLAPPAGVEASVADIDTMELGNPFITYDAKTNGYYMVADGGCMWTSKDLRHWNGPFEVLRHDTASWIGASPVITSPEIHKYNNRYYYMATFEVPGCTVNDAAGVPFTRRSCVALVADSIAGPYRTIDGKSDLLVVEEMAAHPTFCTDERNVGYMIYNHQGEQNGDATVQIVRFTPDLGRRMGEAYVMFTASQNSWSRSNDGKGQFAPLMDSPHLFYTGDYTMGILFNTYIGDERAVGVAYSQTATLNGPWVIDGKPLLADGAAMTTMFKDYDGTMVMVATVETVLDGRKRRVPRLFKMDSQFDKLEVKGFYKF